MARRCNAEAVKISLERLIRPDHPLVFDKARPYQSAYNMIRAVETPDELTVVLKLHHPSAILLANLAMFPASIVSPAALKKAGRRLCRASRRHRALSLREMEPRPAARLCRV